MRTPGSRAPRVAVARYAFNVFVLGTAIAKHTSSDEGCPAPLAGACIGFLLMLLTSALSVSGMVRGAPNGEGEANGVGQSSVVAAYAGYLVLSAMVNNPSAECRPFAVKAGGSVAMQVTGLVIVFLSILWSAIRMGSSSKVANGSFSPVSQSLIGDADDDDNKQVEDDEAEEVQYDYALFHFTFGCAAMCDPATSRARLRHCACACMACRACTGFAQTPSKRQCPCALCAPVPLLLPLGHRAFALADSCVRQVPVHGADAVGHSVVKCVGVGMRGTLST